MILGYVVYLIVAVFTGDVIDNSLWLLSFYVPSWEDAIIARFNLHDRKSVQSRKTFKSVQSSSASYLHSGHHEDSGHHAIFDLGSDMMRKDSEIDHNAAMHDHDRPSNLYATDGVH